MPSLAASLTVFGLAVQFAVAAPWSAQEAKVDTLEARTHWNKDRCYSYFKNCGTQVKNVNENSESGSDVGYFRQTLTLYLLPSRAHRCLGPYP